MIGDLLAAGASSATFPASDGKISQKKWDAIFDGWEPEKSYIGPTKTVNVEEIFQKVSTLPSFRNYHDILSTKKSRRGRKSH